MEKEVFALGVDLGWVSQLESMGVRWVDENREIIDPLEAVKQLGSDSVRLRVFVNPPKSAFWQKRENETCMLGFCDPQSVLEMSKRIHAAGLRLMIDIHYSDHFADPQFQDTPAEWVGLGLEELKGKVAEHTKEVLSLLKENGIVPDWVQVGNEINSGILHPMGSIKENPENLVALLNAGYDAVKEICPETPVITHIAGAPIKAMLEKFLETFFGLGGKTDIIGLSYYPYWMRMFMKDYDKEPYIENLTALIEKYQKPLMIVEVGGPETDPEETYQLLEQAIRDTKALPEGKGLGVFYWEPEVGAELLPDKYPLGAAVLVEENRLQFTKALSAYADSKKA